MYLHNTLTSKKEKFIPLDEKNVRMYACGPTVYDRAHLGNARSATVYDILFRVLRVIYGDKNITYVRNITDVDDKINQASKERNIPIQELTQEMTKYYHSDMEALHNLKPTIEPKATKHIRDIIHLIENLIKNRNAYIADKHVLFDVNSYKDYGKLSGRTIEDMIAGARVEVESYKKNPADFVLWKPASEKDDKSSIFESPWGKGRPGWHIECSAMSTKYLGKTFDIHGGGADLKFPHHENEIAQSLCAFPGSKYAKYWVHNGFLMVEGEKMSKSLGNFTTVKALLDEGIEGIVIRYLFLQTHYRKPLDFTRKALEDAKNSLISFHTLLNNVDTTEKKIPDEILDPLKDDLNTPKVITVLHSFKDNQELKKLKNSLVFLGLYDENLLKNIKKLEKDLRGLDIKESEILKKIELRNKVRAEKNWGEADKIRDELKEKGIILKDEKNETIWIVEK
ncbi:cysteine--tRNA ligase [Pseudomonadota bacterium]